MQRNSRVIPACFGAVGVIVLSAVPALASWPSDPMVNLPVCVDSARQEHVAVVSDAAGGIIIVWQDWRNAAGDIYVQRISAAGDALWTADGVAVCTAAGEQDYPVLASDGAGGAIIVWDDDRNTDVYAQRISAAGEIQWAVDGVTLCTAAGSQRNAAIQTDGAGGAFVTWTDWRTTADDIYAQRIDPDGNLLWGDEALPVCTAASHQYDPEIATDDSGGVVIVWYDYRNGFFTSNDIYMQRVTGEGSALWATDGVPVIQYSGDQRNPVIVPTGTGAATIVWQDRRDGNWDIYAQAIDDSGSAQWAANGVPVYVAAGTQYHPAAAPDGAGGAMVTWYDYSDGDVYAQRISSTGTLPWGEDGVIIGSETHVSSPPVIISDGSGGAIVSWRDFRTMATYHVFAQRLAGDGNVQWSTNGVAVCLADGGQGLPTIATDGSGGVIIAWEDSRNVWFDGNIDVYAQLVRSDGQLGDEDPTGVSAAPAFPLAFALHANAPNPMKQGTTLDFDLPRSADVTVRVFDVSGRLVSTLLRGTLESGRHRVVWDGRDASSRAVSSGVYFCRMEANGSRQTRKILLTR